MTPLPEDAVHAAARLIARADGLLVTAGAGMGVDSELPDFRGNEGLWRAYPALARGRMDFASVASPATFRRDPRLAWGFYGHRLDLYRRTVPHQGFALLRRWAGRMAHGAFVFTSNVDGQFGKAGFDDDAVCECHGSIHHLQCTTPCAEAIWPADGMAVSIDARACRWLGALPACPRCSALARPNILMFGDGDWLSARTDRQHGWLRSWLARAARPVVVELGAGTQVPSVRMFGERLLAGRGAGLVRINPRQPQVPPSPVAVGLPAGALDALRAIDAVLGGGRRRE